MVQLIWVGWLVTKIINKPETKHNRQSLLWPTALLVLNKLYISNGIYDCTFYTLTKEFDLCQNKQINDCQCPSTEILTKPHFLH